MNPFQNKSSYQQSLSYLDSIRDKTKSHMHQPILINTPPYNTKQNHLNLSLNNISVGQTSPLTSNYSDKYKTYYLEGFGQDKSLQKRNLKYDSIQPYTRFSVNDLNQNNSRPNMLPHSPSMMSDKSLQRKRFFTVTSKSPQHSQSSSLNNQQYQQQSSFIINQQQSSPMISQQSYATQNISGMLKQQKQKVSKKETHRLTAHGPQISKTQSNISPQQKSKQKRPFTEANTDYTRISSHNNGESLLMENKQNKKISLKRDVISPRYEEFQQQKKLLLRQNQNSNQNQTHFSNLSYPHTFTQERDNLTSFKKMDDYFYQSDSSLLKITKPSSDQLFLNKNTMGTQSVGNIDENTKINHQKLTNQIPSNNLLSKNQQIIEIVQPSYHNNETKQQTQQFIPTPKSKSPNKNIVIDSDIYQDMKISRIEQSTLTLQAKLLQLQKTVQTLLTTYQLQQKTISTLLTADQQQQKTINQLKAKLQLQHPLSNTNRITPNNHQIDPHQDLKKIKKQIKIIKNNFQLAFTSMTEQINRKLIKQQQIMKNLSDQIKTIASENIKLSQSIQQKSSKVLELQKSMTSFMQQNQERIQNLVLLNDSCSSSANKRNRNNHSSFEYGLELKNISAEDGGLSGREKEVVEILRVKVEGVEKEIKKMKVFHMEEKEVGLRSMNELKEIMSQFKTELNNLTTRCEQRSVMIPQMVSENMKGGVPLIINQVFLSINEKLIQQQERFTLETKSLRESLMDMGKLMNEELQKFERGKLLHKQQQIRKEKDSLSLSVWPIKGDSSILQRQIMSLKDKMSLIEQKLLTIDRRFTTIQQKTTFLYKWHQDCKIRQQDSKIKELKQSGDIKQLQQLYRQLKTRFNEFFNKNRIPSNIEEVTSGLSYSISSMNESIISLKVTVNGINMQIEQMLNASKIQTQNIQSINNEFQRVINKEIIPKFHQIHTHHLQTQKKLLQLQLLFQQKQKSNNLLSSQFLSQLKSSGYGQNHQNAFYGQDLHSESSLFKKVQSFVNENINKFINTKVKLFSTKLISSNSPLFKLSPIQTNSTTIIQNDSEIETQIYRQRSYQNCRQDSYLVERQNTYLVDENGYLMDWEGAYLMEMRGDGTRSKIRLSDKDIYFMEVNGINITHTQQYP